jgi:hypothetical protein
MKKKEEKMKKAIRSSFFTAWASVHFLAGKKGEEKRGTDIYLLLHLLQSFLQKKKEEQIEGGKS